MMTELNFNQINDYHLLANVFVIPTEFGGRKQPIKNSYRGQFFWHINDVNCTDWVAEYWFENGKIELNESGTCKIKLGPNILAVHKGFEIGKQFAIREGARVVAVGSIVETNVIQKESKEN